MVKVEDIESGSGSVSVSGLGNNDNLLYPGMTENPELRWAFIRKVYAILTFQLILTTAISAVVVCVRPVSHFFHTPLGFGVSIALGVVSIFLLFPMHYWQKKHPLNLFLLVLFTTVFASMVGSFCALNKGKIVLEGAGLTCIAVVVLTLYTFCAVKKGANLSFLGPFILCSSLVLVAFTLLQIFLPMGNLIHAIWSVGGAILFSGFIIHDTEKLIKTFTYDEYISAALCLYLDIINLFMYFVDALQSADN